MDIQNLIFWIFAALAVASALRVVTVRNPVHATLFLVLTFFSTAAIWLLMEAEFLAIALVLVYVGAVMVLFLFVVMMLDINLAPMREGFTRYLPVGVVVGVTMLAEVVLVLVSKAFAPNQLPAPNAAGIEQSNTEILGEALYTDYLYQLEIAAVILLVAIIAAISLTMRRRPETKYQNPSQQVQVRKQDRLRIVKMAAETGHSTSVSEAEQQQ